MYGWSKYGGGRHGLVKEDLDIWYCQVCGEKQTKTLPSYMFQAGDEREFVRICSKCRFKATQLKIRKMEKLFDVVRKKFIEDTWK